MPVSSLNQLFGHINGILSPHHDIFMFFCVSTFCKRLCKCRNARRESMKQLDKHEKDGDLSEDEKKALADSIQELTDTYVKEIDKLAKTKQDELIKI